MNKLINTCSNMDIKSSNKGMNNKSMSTYLRRFQMKLHIKSNSNK